MLGSTLSSNPLTFDSKCKYTWTKWISEQGEEKRNAIFRKDFSFWKHRFLTQSKRIPMIRALFELMQTKSHGALKNKFLMRIWRIKLCSIYVAMTMYRIVRFYRSSNWYILFYYEVSSSWFSYNKWYNFISYNFNLQKYFATHKNFIVAHNLPSSRLDQYMKFILYMCKD